MRFGAVINAAAIILGAVLGILGGNLFGERVKETMFRGIGVCTMFIGGGGALAKMFVPEGTSLSVQGSVMSICCLVLGGMIGEALDIEGALDRMGAWLKEKSGNGKDGGFIDAFVTTTLIVGIGAMAVVGSIQDGLTGDYSVLLVKSLLDLLFVVILASKMGKGCAFASVPVLLFEGGLTLLAGLLAPLVTEAVLANLSQVGSMMIFMIGVNIIRPGTFRAGNYLPALVFAVLWAALALPMT